RLITREDALQRAHPELFRQQLAEDVAEVGRHGEVAVLEELLRVESWPLAVHLSALHAAACDQHYVGVAVIGAAVAVLADGAAELRILAASNDSFAVPPSAPATASA